jgi:hypothetical protein
MKKIVILALIASILAIASCAKNISTNGGTWTLNNQTYKATQAYFVSGGLTAYTGTGVPTGSLTLFFRDADTIYHGVQTYDSIFQTSWPPLQHSYILTNSYPPPIGYVCMQLTDSSLYNEYRVTNSATGIVTITVKDSIVTSAIIPAVQVANINTTPAVLGGQRYVGAPTGTDISMVAGKIMQTQ